MRVSSKDIDPKEGEIPVICMKCHKYIRGPKVTEANKNRVSHGLCQECLDKYYPEGKETKLTSAIKLLYRFALEEIPVVCMWCKQHLRGPEINKQNYMDVSHGICRECVKKHYPDFARKQEMKEKMRLRPISKEAQKVQLTSEEVVDILLSQPGNKDKDRESLKDRWVVSNYFILEEIPIDSIGAASGIKEGERSQSSGPIIVEKNVREVGRLRDSKGNTYGSPPDVLILDGKHRVYEAKQRGEKIIQAYVGDKVSSYLQQKSEEYSNNTNKVEELKQQYLNSDAPGGILMELKMLLPSKEIEDIRALWREKHGLSPRKAQIYIEPDTEDPRPYYHWKVKFMRRGYEPPRPFGKTEMIICAHTREEAKGLVPASPSYSISASRVDISVPVSFDSVCHHKKITAQHTYRLRYKDPLSNYQERIDKIGQIKASALEYVETVFLEYEIPTIPTFAVASVRGFSDPDKPLSQTTGVILVTASFDALSGHTIRFDVPVPMSRGEFHRPSIILLEGKRAVLSQELINNILAKLDTQRPRIQQLLGIYGKEPGKVMHQPNVEKGLWGVPSDVTGWSDLIQERY